MRKNSYDNFILERMRDFPQDAFTVFDFIDVIPLESARKRLRSLRSHGLIYAVASGIYSLPDEHGGTSLLNPHSVAVSAARLNWSYIVPMGDTALKSAGLIDQRDGEWQYITDKPCINITYDNINIKFRQCKNASTMADTSYDALFAVEILRTLGPDNVDKKFLYSLAIILDRDELLSLSLPSDSIPAWITDLFAYFSNVITPEPPSDDEETLYSNGLF